MISGSCQAAGKDANASKEHPGLRAGDCFLKVFRQTLALQVHAANIQDVHGAVPLLKHIGLIFPNLRHMFADRVYRGKQLPLALTDFGKWFIEIVTRSESIGTFKAEPKRWVIERTFAWLNRCRPMSRMYQ
jgi:putative transposase